jgi:hypothetical protein
MQVAYGYNGLLHEVYLGYKVLVAEAPSKQMPPFLALTLKLFFAIYSTKVALPLP